jgi:CBS domain-containing protein
MKAKDIMQRDLTSILADESIDYFIKICKRHNVSALPVVDNNYSLVGYLSESGVIKAALPDYLSLMQTSAFIPDSHQFFTGLNRILERPVKDFMEAAPLKVHPEDTVLYVADIMIKNRLKFIPVVNEENRLIGNIQRISLLSNTLNEDFLE